MNSIHKINTLAILLLFGLIFHVGISCQGAENPPPTPDSDQMKQSQTKIIIQVGIQTFTVTLAENPAVTRFIAMLPLTLEMGDLNSNEKFAQLPQKLPTQTFNPGTIQNGDLKLWGANTVVIFYETFPTTYSYTSLGKIDDPDGLKAALGAGDVTVAFSKK